MSTASLNSREMLLVELACRPTRESLIAWLNQTNLADLDPSSFQLLPMVSQAMQHFLPDHPEARRIQGVARQIWVRNQLVLSTAVQLFKALKEHGIRCLFLKGLPLALRYYSHVGLRNVGPADVLVPYGQRMEALQVCFKLGWESARVGDLELNLEIWKHHPLRKASEVEVNLHWALSNEESGAYQEELFARAVALQVPGIEDSALTLDSTDTFFLACIAGKDSPTAGLRWLVDASIIWHHQGWDDDCGPDWAVMMETARRMGATFPLLTGLGQLKNQFQFAIPDSVIQTLEKQPVAWSSRVFDSLLRADQLDLWQRLCLKILLYRRQRKKRSPLVFLMKLWGAKNLREFVGMGLAKLR